MIHLAAVRRRCPLRGIVDQFQPELSASDLTAEEALGAGTLQPHNPGVRNARLAHMFFQSPAIVNHVAPLADLANLVVQEVDYGGRRGADGAVDENVGCESDFLDRARHD
jgi:hypothetical protein